MPKRRFSSTISPVEPHVPGGEEFDEFVRLLVGFIWRILEVLQVVRCHKGQISNTACSAAPT